MAFARASRVFRGGAAAWRWGAGDVRGEAALTLPPALIDEHLLSMHSAQERRARGMYFTPEPLAAATLDWASPLLPEGRFRIIDPACGNGVFLRAAAARFPRAELWGLDISAPSVASCQQALPSAHLFCDNALEGGLERLPPAAGFGGTFELWVGNPPYNGTSPTLKSKQSYSRLQKLLPKDARLPAGGSLREDFIFFLLQASERLRHVPGALAFVTSSTFLDSFLYAPVRQHMLSALQLVSVYELGQGIFDNTRVRSCVTLWRTPGETAPPPTHCRRLPSFSSSSFSPNQLSAMERFSPRGPEWTLRPSDAEAEALHASWTARGEPLNVLVPVSFPGLKTRFDELLVDRDPARLFQRVSEFLRTPEAELSTFAAQHGMGERLLDKLRALSAAARKSGVLPDDRHLWPFLRYAGLRHRDGIPDSARAYCYLDRRLIPRGDHRFQGSYNPHACPVKLVFNAREHPLAACVTAQPGCIHDYQHTRFAPATVPESIYELGLLAARRGRAEGPEVVNLSQRGRVWAERLGGAENAYSAIARFVLSEPVQKCWAPAFATSRQLPIPLD